MGGKLLGYVRVVEGGYKPPEVRLSHEETRGQWHECIICGSDKIEQVHQSIQYVLKNGEPVMIDIRSRRCTSCGVMEDYDDPTELALAEVKKEGGAA